MVEKNDASFRVIVTESTRGPKAGNAVEVLGFYDPNRNTSEIKSDRVKHWISVGAQVSDTVHNILVGQKIIKGKKINVLSKKNPIVKKVEADGVKDEDVADAPAEDASEEKLAEETPKEEEQVEEKRDIPVEQAEEVAVEETKEESTEETKKETK